MCSYLRSGVNFLLATIVGDTAVIAIEVETLVAPDPTVRLMTLAVLTAVGIAVYSTTLELSSKVAQDGQARTTLIHMSS